MQGIEIGNKMKQTINRTPNHVNLPVQINEGIYMQSFFCFLSVLLQHVIIVLCLFVRGLGLLEYLTGRTLRNSSHITV